MKIPWQKSKSLNNNKIMNPHHLKTQPLRGCKNPDDAILFTDSGITAIVEQKFQLKVIKGLLFSKKNKMYQNLFLFLEVKRTLHGSQKPKSLNLSKTIAANEVRIQF